MHVIDISDPANPFEVREAFIPTSAGSFVGEGIQVIPIKNEFFNGDLLIHQNESCRRRHRRAPNLRGGISMWDVTDPTHPQPVALHTGDFTNARGAGSIASAEPDAQHVAWTNNFDGRTYVVLVDDEELTDIDILDITDPYHPVLVNDTLDLAALFGVDQAGTERPDARSSATT